MGICSRTRVIITPLCGTDPNGHRPLRDKAEQQDGTPKGGSAVVHISIPEIDDLGRKQFEITAIPVAYWKVLCLPSLQDLVIWRLYDQFTDLQTKGQLTENYRDKLS